MDRTVSSVTLWVLAVFAVVLSGAALYATPTSYLDRLVPRVQWATETVSGTSSEVAVLEGAAGSAEQVFRWGQPIRVAARTADVCACFSMTSTFAMTSSRCGLVTDASDGATATAGLCVMLPAGSISEIAVRKTDFTRQGVGRRSGVCSAADAGRPCRVNGDCYSAATCTGGGVSVDDSEDIASAGAYLLLQAANGSTAGSVTTTILGSEHR